MELQTRNMQPAHLCSKTLFRMIFRPVLILLIVKDIQQKPKFLWRGDPALKGFRINQAAKNDVKKTVVALLCISLLKVFFYNVKMLLKLLEKFSQIKQNKKRKQKKNPSWFHRVKRVYFKTICFKKSSIFEEM